MDIDDLLAEAGGQAAAQETSDLQALVRAWVTERSAPEILPWPDSLMKRVLQRINHQIELVELQTGDTDPKTNFRLIIIQTELERFKFLVRSFLRTRITKAYPQLCPLFRLKKSNDFQIDKHVLFILKTASLSSRLSLSELQYAKTHQSILEAHYHSSFLGQFPTSLQKLDDTAGGISMVEQPDVDKAVFLRALRHIDAPIFVEGTDMGFQMKKGDIYVVRWSAIREIVLGGDAELI